MINKNFFTFPLKSTIITESLGYRNYKLSDMFYEHFSQGNNLLYRRRKESQNWAVVGY